MGILNVKAEEQPKPKKSNKRKTLRNNFQKLVDGKDDEKIIEFLKRCETDAYGGAPVRSALGFNVSETVMDWLVKQGADINFTNSYGATPLHHHAGMRTGNVKYLLKLGADINVIVRDMSLVGLALRHTGNINIPACVNIMGYLLNKGVKLKGNEEKEVIRIGKDFEFYYDTINSGYIDELEAGLHRLYKLFDDPPVPKRQKQESDKPIKVTAATWQEQYNELWNLLVTAQNHANTLQGETVRICGRLSREIPDNGRMNWADYVNCP